MIGTVPLPAYAHVPGRNARHPDGAFDDICEAAQHPTSSATAGTNRAWLAGLDFLEHGFYWEAHEVLEPVWMNAPANGRERFLAQALIQLANAALKQVMDRPGAALRLCAVARGHLARVGDRPAMGLAPARVADAIDALEAAIADGRPARILIRGSGSAG